MPTSQQIAISVIDHWLSHLIRNSDLPGAQIRIRRKGKILFKKCNRQNAFVRRQVIAMRAAFQAVD